MLVRQWFVFETPDTVTVQQMYTFTSYFATLDKVSQSLDHKHHLAPDDCATVDRRC
jgi:hypothetical protein